MKITGPEKNFISHKGSDDFNVTFLMSRHENPQNIKMCTLMLKKK